MDSNWFNVLLELFSLQLCLFFFHKLMKFSKDISYFFSHRLTSKRHKNTIEISSIYWNVLLWIFLNCCLNPLRANFTKWSNKLKQFVGKLPTNCLSVFDHFVELALKGLINFFIPLRRANEITWENFVPAKQDLGSTKEGSLADRK